MMLRYNQNGPIEIIGIGIFGSGDLVLTDDPVKAKKYKDTGYFDIVKEKKKVKKSKKERS